MTPLFMPAPITPDHPLWPILDEEQRLLARVQVRLASLTGAGATRGDHDRELLDLRDQIAEARMEDVPALVDQMLQAAALKAQRGLSIQLPANPQQPYFAHLRLQEGAKTRDVLIGKRSYIDPEAGITIVDWRHAPVSRIYYRYDEGDEYEEEFGERAIQGRVLLRRTLSVLDGRLTRIRTPDATLMADGKGGWVQLEAGHVPELHGGVGVAARPPRQDAPQEAFSRRQLGLGGDGVLREDKRLPEIAALIDRAQFDLITRPEAGVVVLQGGAGSGKTTVALHRVAYLHFSNPQRFRPRFMRVLVSQKALVAYIGKVLPSLDVGATPVVTMEDFLARLRAQLFPRLKRGRIHDVPETVSRLKKHPAMLKLLEERVAWLTQEHLKAVEQVCARLKGGERLTQVFAEGGKTLWARFKALERAIHAAPTPVQDRMMPWLRGALADLEMPLEDLQEALTDPVLLKDVFGRHAPGQFTDDKLRTLVDFVGRQASEAEDMSYIDEDRRAPLGEDAEDHSDPTWRLDHQDDALLIRYHQLTHGGLVPPGQSAVEFDHVAADEAQDLSAVEIQILADAVRGRSLTLAGDTAQRLVFDNGFDTWEGLLKHLQIPALNVSTLKVAYRSTRQVMAVARHILGPLADPDPPKAPREGAPVEGFLFSELGEEVAFLADALRGLMGRERGANLALITRYASQADIYYDALSKAEVPFLRRVAHQDFTFTPGVDVTDVTQVKGLEYDYVIMAGVDESSYNESLESRHLLHIGATRAAHQLWFTSHRQPTALLPPTLLAPG